MPLDRRQFMQGIASLPLAGSTLGPIQQRVSIEPPTLLWELFALLPARAPDGEPIRLTGTSGEMIFPGTLQSTPGISPEQVRPILEADTKHMLDMHPVTPDESLTRFCGVALDGIDAIASFKPCTVFIGDFSTEEVHASWEDIGYAQTDDADIWSWKGLSDHEHDAEAADALLAMQRRLSLPPRSWGRYRFLTCIDVRFVVEAETAAMLRHIRARYADQANANPLADGPFGSSGSVPATIGHVAKLYEADRFVTRHREAEGREGAVQTQNLAVLTSIENELGRMPHVGTALLSITPGTPWRETLEAAELPNLASFSLVHIHLDSSADAERYLAIATARFETLTSWYTGEPYSQLFAFEGHASGSRVTIDLQHRHEPRYDVLQMAYFEDLAFLTWEPEDRDTWRSVR